MWVIIRQHGNFFIPYFLFLLIGGIVQLFYSQTLIFLFFNSHYSPLADFFFTYWTNVGDGIFALFVVLLLGLFYRYKAALLGFCVYAVSGLLAQFLKHVVFSGLPRPSAFF